MKRKKLQGPIEQPLATTTSKILFHPNEIYTFNSPRLQNFSLPSDVINFVNKNNKNSKVHEKLIKTCKYFYSKNYVIVVEDFKIPSKNSNLKIINSSKFWIKKFWIIGDFIVNSAINEKTISNLFPKFYRCDITFLHLINQEILFDEFNFLISSGTIETFHFDNVIVKNTDGEVANLEKILERLPKIKKFYYSFSDNQPNCSTETTEKIVQLPYFKNLERFYLCEIPETFNIKKFYDFIKKQPKTDFYLRFCSYLSLDYTNRLQMFVDGIVSVGLLSFCHPPPLIEFDKQNPITFEKLLSLRQTYFEDKK